MLSHGHGNRHTENHDIYDPYAAQRHALGKQNKKVQDSTSKNEQEQARAALVRDITQRVGVFTGQRLIFSPRDTESNRRKYSNEIPNDGSKYDYKKMATRKGYVHIEDIFTDPNILKNFLLVKQTPQELATVTSNVKAGLESSKYTR